MDLTESPCTVSSSPSEPIEEASVGDLLDEVSDFGEPSGSPRVSRLRGPASRRAPTSMPLALPSSRNLPSGALQRWPADAVETVLAEDEERSRVLQESVPAHHHGQRRFKYGGCPHHASLSLQPALTRSGKNKGQIYLRCSSWFRRDPARASKRCWYAIPFPMGLFSQLPETIRWEYTSVEMTLARNVQRG